MFTRKTFLFATALSFPFVDAAIANDAAKYETFGKAIADIYRLPAVIPFYEKPKSVDDFVLPGGIVYGMQEDKFGDIKVWAQNADSLVCNDPNTDIQTVNDGQSLASLENFRVTKEAEVNIGLQFGKSDGKNFFKVDATLLKYVNEVKIDLDNVEQYSSGYTTLKLREKNAKELCPELFEKGDVFRANKVIVGDVTFEFFFSAGTQIEVATKFRDQLMANFGADASYTIGTTDDSNGRIFVKIHGDDMIFAGFFEKIEL